MKHNEFVDLYAKGQAKVIVDRSEAMDVCDKDPRIGKQRRLTHKIGWGLCLIALVAGPVSIIWFPWYFGIGIFVVLGLGGGAIARTVASSFVRETALEDSDFYTDMIKNEVMTVSKQGG